MLTEGGHKLFAIALILTWPLFTGAEASLKDLGYLFTSPAQREDLNAMRDQHQRGQHKKNERQKQTQASYKFNGLISKDSQTQYIWINGSTAPVSQARRARHGRYQVDLPSGRVYLKPGQVYQPASGKVVEPYVGSVP